MNLSYRRQKSRMQTATDLSEVIIAGASQRIHPILVTSLASFIELLPIIMEHNAGADVMKRIATPR